MLHLSPSYFSKDSIIGGGERYAAGLATAMAREVEVEFIAFGRRGLAYREGSLSVRVLPSRYLIERSPMSSFSPRILPHLLHADVLHCHQFCTPMCDTALIVGKLLNKKVFVTPLGGGSPRTISSYLDIGSWARGFLHISEFSRHVYGQICPSNDVIYGGVDAQQFSPGPAVTERDGVLFVGRVLPHKGVDYLVQGMPADVPLRIVGQPYHQQYLADLKELANGKRVEFIFNATDADLSRLYRSSQVTVLPSVYLDRYGQRTNVPELLGQTLLESMASGTPVIATSVGSLPEVVRDGVTGFLVAPNDAAALRGRIDWMNLHSSEAAQIGLAAREDMLARFTWGRTVERCLNAYVS